MKDIKLDGIYYSPGYGDMRGEYHEISLQKSKDGDWIYVSTDREYYREPTITTTYSVSPEDVEQFEEFLAKKRVFSLANKPNSDMFMTDYHPWSWGISYETTSSGRTRKEYLNIEEYKRYSERDFKLIKELREKFTSMRGEKISEVSKENT